MPMLSFRVSDDLWARLNEACGEDRSAWARSVIEQALVGVPTSPPKAVSANKPQEKDRVAAFRHAEILRRAKISPSRL